VAAKAVRVGACEFGVYIHDECGPALAVVAATIEEMCTWSATQLGFLRQRSIEQGKTPEEVDALLASMQTGPTAATSPFAEPSSKES